MQILDIDAGSGIGAGGELPVPSAGPVSPQAGDAFASLVDLLLARLDDPAEAEAGQAEPPSGEPDREVAPVVTAPVPAVPVNLPAVEAAAQPPAGAGFSLQPVSTAGFPGVEPAADRAVVGPAPQSEPRDPEAAPADRGTPEPVAAPNGNAGRLAAGGHPDAADRADAFVSEPELVSEPEPEPAPSREGAGQPARTTFTTAATTALERDPGAAAGEPPARTTVRSIHAREAAGEGGRVSSPGTAEPDARADVRAETDPVAPPGGQARDRVRRILASAAQVDGVRAAARPDAASAVPQAPAQDVPRQAGTQPPPVPSTPLAANIAVPAGNAGPSALQTAAGHVDPVTAAGQPRAARPPVDAAPAAGSGPMLPQGPSSAGGPEAASANRSDVTAARVEPAASGKIEAGLQAPAVDAQSEPAGPAGAGMPAAIQPATSAHAAAGPGSTTDGIPGASPAPLSVPAAPGASEASAATPLSRMPAPYAAPTPADDRENLNTMVRSIRIQAGQEQGGEARLQLRPEHLGQVAVTIRVEQGAVTAHVQAESPQAQRWIEGHQQELRSSLREQGLEVRSLTVTTDPDRREQRREGQARERLPKPRGRAAGPDGEAPRFEVRV